ncbi:MAG: hypothetical protein AB7K37_11490 [Cyclobacteriaceae bacterium]
MQNIDLSLLYCDSSAMIYFEESVRGFIIAQTGPWSWEKYKILLLKTLDFCRQAGQPQEINLLIERLYLSEMQADDLDWISDHIYTKLDQASVAKIAYVCSILDTIKKRDIALPPIPNLSALQHRIFFSKRTAKEWLER